MEIIIRITAGTIMYQWNAIYIITEVNAALKPLLPLSKPIPLKKESTAKRRISIKGASPRQYIKLQKGFFLLVNNKIMYSIVKIPIVGKG